MCKIHVLASKDSPYSRSANGDGFKFKLKFQNRNDESRSIYYYCNTVLLTYSGSCNNNVYYECISEYGNDIIQATIEGYVRDLIFR